MTRVRVTVILLVCLLAGAAATAFESPQTAAAKISVPEGESIQTAIDNASTGDIIVISGIHYEQIEIDTPLTLRGDNATLWATGTGTMVKIIASNATLDDLTIEGNGSAHIGVELIGRTAATANVTISNVTISGCQWYGVWTRRLTVSPMITNATITRCGTGIQLDINVTHAAVTYSTICNNTYGVVAAMDATNASIHHNVFNNTHNARDTTPLSSTNRWDNGSVGNYWSDYQRTDSGNDDIGDSPYQISGGSHRDRYPLIHRPGSHTGSHGNGSGGYNGIPGFGILLSLIAMVVLMASLRRHRSNEGE